jgi:large subunit ribosomal protein L2
MPLEYVPIGLFVYNIELTPGKGGQIVRGAGNGAQLQVIEGDFAQLKLPSGEMRLVSKNCLASVGMVSNPDFRLVRLGKAGRKRKLGWRPAVEGKNMNPVDHPHGGGEGHSPIGLKGGPRTPWGKKALGVKTRKPGKWSNKFIVQRRVKKS